MDELGKRHACCDLRRRSIVNRIYPRTPLAQLTREEGIIEAKDDLLQPRFYIRPGLETFIRAAIAAS
jgi:hypothetical protein